MKSGDINWEEVFDGCDWLHLSGITPAIGRDAAVLSIESVKKACEMGLKVSLDLNYRKSLWNYGVAPSDIIPQMMPSVNVLIGDPATINTMLGLDLPALAQYSQPEDLEAPYSELVDRYKDIECVGMILRDVMSAQHNKVQGVIYHKRKIASSRIMEINPIVQRIGGGDVFTAGLIYGLQTKMSSSEAIDFAIASSALKMTVEGDYSLFRADDILDFLKNKALGAISR